MRFTLLMIAAVPAAALFATPAMADGYYGRGYRGGVTITIGTGGYGGYGRYGGFYSPYGYY